MNIICDVDELTLYFIKLVSGQLSSANLIKALREGKMSSLYNCLKASPKFTLAMSRQVNINVNEHTKLAQREKEHHKFSWL